MASKAPANIPAPPPPPAPATPVVDNTAATPVVPPPPPTEPVDPAPQLGTSGSPEPTITAQPGPEELSGGEPIVPPAEANDGGVNGPVTKSAELHGGEPIVPPAEANDGGVNGPVTKSAELHGGVKASDYKKPPYDDEDFSDLPDERLSTRQQEVSKRGFVAGRKGSPLGKRRKAMTDADWSQYQTAHARGVSQGEADKLSGVERMERVERALGLPVTGAVVYAEETPLEAEKQEQADGGN